MFELVGSVGFKETADDAPIGPNLVLRPAIDLGSHEKRNLGFALDPFRYEPASLGVIQNKAFLHASTALRAFLR